MFEVWKNLRLTIFSSIRRVKSLEFGGCYIPSSMESPDLKKDGTLGSSGMINYVEQRGERP